MDHVEGPLESTSATPHPALLALVRFLNVYDLDWDGDLPDGFEPIISPQLEENFGAVLDGRAGDRHTFLHGPHKIAIQTVEVDGRTFFFAGASPRKAKDGPEPPAKRTATRANPASAHGRSSAWAAPVDEPSDGVLERFYSEHIQGLRGKFHSLRPRDLVQFFCTLSATVEVHFQSDAGESGCVLMERGRVLHVELEGDSGLDAVSRLIEWETGTFLTMPLREDAPHSLDISWMQVLIERATKHDESLERAAQAEQIDAEILGDLPDWLDT